MTKENLWKFVVLMRIVARTYARSHIHIHTHIRTCKVRETAGGKSSVRCKKIKYIAEHNPMHCHTLRQLNADYNILLPSPWLSLISLIHQHGLLIQYCSTNLCVWWWPAPSAIWLLCLGVRHICTHSSPYNTISSPFHFHFVTNLFTFSFCF